MVSRVELREAAQAVPMVFTRPKFRATARRRPSCTATDSTSKPAPSRDPHERPDSETVRHACVFDIVGSWYMLYDGNRYGRTGFSHVTLDQG